jgi:hypothetical protein
MMQANGRSPQAAVGGPDSSDEEFLSRTDHVPDIIEDERPSLAVGPGAAAAPEEKPEPSIDTAVVRGSVRATVSLIFSKAADRMKDPQVKLSEEEADTLADAWTPVAKFYLDRLGNNAMWAAALIPTTMIAGGKAAAHKERVQAAQRAKEARPPFTTASTRMQESGGSSVSLENATAEKPPTFGSEYGPHIAV